LGIALVPLLANGVVTKGRRVGIAALGDQIRPIHSGILYRKGAALPAPAREFVAFLQRKWPASGKALV
jgi:hypothetical protein